MKSSAAVASELVGLPVLWHISDFRSAVAIDLGKRIELRRAISNPKLTTEQQKYQGEASVFIQCGWQLIAPGGLQETDPAALEGQDWAYLDGVVGKSIVAASIADMTLALSLRFEDESVLNCGPLIYPYRMTGGYHVAYRGHSWAVSDQCEITEHVGPWPP